MNRPVSKTGFRLGAVFSPVLNFLYPAVCVACDWPVRRPDNRIPVCDSCLDDLPEASPDLVRDRLSLLEDIRLPDYSIALWEYAAESTVARLQHSVKYYNNPMLGVALGEFLGHQWIDAGLPLPEVLIPIPLARSRELERGYNQSAALADGFRRVCADADTAIEIRNNVLVRDRLTRSQTRLSRHDRRANVAGSLRLTNAASIRGRSILIIDDVLTTGATAAAALDVVAPGEATTVGVAVLACAKV